MNNLSKATLTNRSFFYFCKKNLDRDIFVISHVDDFLCSGKPSDVAWAKSELGKASEVNVLVIGPGSSATYLGRQISWDENGSTTWWRLERCTCLSIPGCDEDKRQEGGDEKLDAKSATIFWR